MSCVFSRLAFVAVLIFFLNACAGKTMIWQRPNTGAEQQRSDLARCQSYARKEAESDYRIDQYGSSSGGGFGDQSTYQQNMDAYLVKKNTKGLVSRCMRQNGYRQVPVGG